MPSADDLIKQYQGPNSATAAAAGGPPASGAPLTADELITNYAPPVGTPTPDAPSAVTQQSGPMRYVNKLGSDLASGVAGIIGTPRALNDLTLAGLEKVLGPAPDWFKKLNGNWEPTVGDANAGANRVGNALGVGPVVDRADLAPQNAAERYGDAIVKGLPAAGLAIISGGAALPAVLSTTGSGVASQGAKDLGIGPWGQVAAGLLGGAVGGAVGTAINTPSVERLASSIGNAKTMQQAGESLQTAARDWLTNVKPAQEEAAWGHVNDIMQDAKVPMNNTLSNLRDLVPDVEKPLGGATAVVQGNQFERMLDSLVPPEVRAKLPQGEVDIFKNWSPSNPPSWEEIKQFRSMIGNIMGRPDMMKGMDEANLQHLYSGLTEDMRNAAEGRALGAEFDNANAESVRLNDIKENVISKIVADAKPSRNDPKPGEAATAVLRGAQHDGTTLQTLREEIPSAVDDLASAHLLMQSPKYVKLNPQGTAPASLSPEAHSALIPDAEVRALIQRIVPQPGKPQLSIGEGAQAIGSAAGMAYLESLLNNGGHAAGAGAALLGAGLPKGLQLLGRAGGLPGIIPGATLGGASALGITNPSGK